MELKESNVKNIIFPIEFNHFSGGMIHSVMDLAEALTENYNVYVLANKEAEVLKFNNKIKPLVLKTNWSISINKPIKTLKTYFKVRQLLKSFNKKNTIVFTNNVGSELIFSGFGFLPAVPLNRIFVSRGGCYEGKTGYFIKKGFNSIKHFVATSKHQSDILENIGIIKSKITIINNGIDINRSLGYQYQFQKQNRIRLSIVGYISENKNQILAVEVLKSLIKKGYDVELNIYGLAVADSDKKYKNKLLLKIKELELDNRINFKGFKSDVKNIYENTDILLSCSLSEGFGRVVVEAMAFGIPCVGLKQSGGLNDIIINNVNGFLTSTDKNNIACKIEELINKSEIRNEISINSINSYESMFSKKIMIDKYINFLKTKVV
ncbi:glycosyltransferase family 4 protein [Chryseobacterium echinoideorum]|uniref:glycosyltransferase family 4 protein n=1 Tax=Chryseobacterium echinoideorum TaxID=1549648 RepID=UPI001186F5D2|nr:glycosyltransferase family 4 protein [Chryseobacterium echinoideorum]